MKKSLLFLIMPKLIFAFCLSIDDPKHPCRYKQGDNWCSTNTIIKQFAYKDNCEGTKGLTSYISGVGTGGWNLVYTKISPIEVLDNQHRRAYYTIVQRMMGDKFNSKNSYIYANCNANGANEISFDGKEYESVEPELTGGMGEVYKKITKEICSAPNIKKEKELNTTFSPKEVAKLLSKAKESSKEYLKESAEVLDEIIVDTKSYGNNRVAIISSYYIKSSSNPYEYKLLSLYEKRGSNLVPLLLNFRLSHTQRDSYSNTDDYFRATHEYKLKSTSDVSKLEFEHIYTFEHEIRHKKLIVKKWSVKLDPKTFVLKNGKFVVVKEKEKPLFNLENVLKNAQKGLRYKKIVLEAMLFELPISKENFETYAKIGQALKRAKHIKESRFLLELIFKSKFKNSLAVEELANIYYENFLRLQKRADLLFKEGKINPSSIATQANANAIKALMLYRVDKKLQKKEGTIFMGKVIDERFEEVEHFVMDNDDVIEFIKTGIYADVTVYDYLNKELQKDMRLIEARDISLKEKIR